MTEKQVLYNSDEAAYYKTDISGWVSGRGYFFGDKKDSEHMARYDGCTHVECKYCGEPARKPYTACEVCLEDQRIKRYFKRELVEYDGKSMLYSETLDKYFHDLDDVFDYIYDEYGENGVTDKDLCLLLCEPVFLRHLDEDYWYDCFPTDGDYEYELPSEVLEAIENLNKVLSDVPPPSWTPGSKRISIENRPI